VQHAHRVAAILPGGKDNQIGIGSQRHGRELPPGRIVGLVGQIPPLQAHHARPGVVDLDPVLLVAVLVVEAGLVHRQELADSEHVLRTRRAARAQDEKKSNSHD
jgi:hypothetical protein